jgi:hypothetical protein
VDVFKKKLEESSKFKKVKNSRIYKLWKHIRSSCRNPNYISYCKHGAKGITISDEWFEDFDSFYKEVGDYQEGFSLALLDKSKGYSTGNCKWIIKEYY